MTVQVTDVDHNIRGKSVPDLKIKKNTSKKPIPVEVNLVQVPEDLVKVQKDIYFMSDMFSVNGIPLLLTLSRKICFAAVNHLDNKKVKTTSKAFKEIYSYYMKCGFHITDLHADG